MMFVTCDKQMAIRHLKKFYPSHEITEENTKEIMEYITADIVRIPDPDFHPGGAVMPSKNWDPTKEKEIVAAFQRFDDSLIKKEAV